MTDRIETRWNGWGPQDQADTLGARNEVWTWLARELGMPSLLATPARPLEELAIAPPRLTSEDRDKFVLLLGPDNVRDDKAERARHALGKSYHDLLRLRAGDLSVAPDAVLYPRNVGDVADVLAYAGERRIAIVPYGGGTSVVGGVTANGEGFNAVVTLDLSQMARLIGVDPVSSTADVEPGITGPALEHALNAQGLTLGHFPQSFEYSTLGGWIAHRGAGQQSHLYGRAEDWLIAADLVTPRGVLHTRDFPASAAGPRLRDFIPGSEGVFGIITRARVRVRTQPAVKHYSGFLFPDFRSGTAAIRTAAQTGLPAAMLRLSDAQETRFYRTFSELGRNTGLRDWLSGHYLRLKGLDGLPAVMIAGFEGDHVHVRDATEAFAKIAKASGALALGRKPGKRWYEGRFHGPYLRDPMMDRGVGVDTLETATHWSNLDTLYRAVKEALEAAIAANAPRPGARGVVMCHISHCYTDGASLYFTYIFPRALDGEIAQWRAIKVAASDAIAAHGGTISHHHGVGEDHSQWIAQEKGELGMEILRAIKRTLDPEGILNPGKFFPN